jgi:hypothetical protein
MHTYPFTAAAILASTVAVGAACAPEQGTCAENTDCPFGQVCSTDGQCVLVGGGAAIERRRGVGEQANDAMGAADEAWVADDIVTITGTGRFEGTIGGAPVDDATVYVDLSSMGTFATFVKPDAPSTFMLLKTASDLTTPGRRTVSTNLDAELVQACNYDGATYDEWFPSYEVEVSPPREATADDPIIAEDTVTTVVDVTVAVVGEGSDVSVTFALPVL